VSVSDEQFRHDLQEMAECMAWYGRVLSPQLTAKDKESLHRRIWDYWAEHDFGKNDNQPSEFPELEKYWSKKYLSGLELYTIMQKLNEELKP
jgi:hypothetical protein